MTTSNMNPLQQNALARMNLLATGISMIKRVQPVAGALGTDVRVNLLRMGVMTGVMLHFTVPVTIAGGVGTPSPLTPFNIAQNVMYTDFAGVNRVNTNGFQLWAGQSLKMGDAINAIPNMTTSAGGSQAYNYNTNILSFPTAIGDGEIKFSLWVPTAYDPANDLTGAILTQTNVGEHYITVSLAKALLNVDPWLAPYTAVAGGGSIVPNGNVTIEAYQYYIQPQAMTADQLPLMDLSTVYGFEGGYKSSANIASGQDTYINYPNNRSILATLIQFENGGVFTPNETDISQVTLLANSNTNFREMSPRLVRETMRNIINSDMPSSTYYIGSRRQPILTQLYANVQAKMSVTTANAGVTQFVSQFEVQYPSGSPLPGITTS